MATLSNALAQDLNKKLGYDRRMPVVWLVWATTLWPYAMAAFHLWRAGFEFGLISQAIMIIGGLDRIPGAMIAGILLGLVAL